MKNERKRKIESAKRATYADMAKSMPGTWAARMPAYASTSIEARGHGIVPAGGTRKKCLCCGKIFEIDSNLKCCVCGKFLYTVNEYYQPSVRQEGGEAVGERKTFKS